MRRETVMNEKVVKVPTITPDEYSKFGLDNKKLKELMEVMLKIRKFEEKVEELFLVKGLLAGPAHLCFGHEAIAAGVIKTLRQGDVILSNHRGHGHAIVLGIPLREIMAELFGRTTGTCKGLGGSMHVAIYPEKGGLYASAIVGSNIPIATGAGFAMKKLGKKNVAVCFFGDGAANTAAFHEGLNMARFLKVSTIFVCENNQYAISMRADKATGVPICERAAYGYGIKSFLVDGTDVLSVWRGAIEAQKISREGEPTFIEAITYRLKGHGVYDKAEYRPKEEAEEWMKKDPIRRFSERLLSEGVMSKEELEDMKTKIDQELEEAVEFSINSPILDFEELFNMVYWGRYP